VFSQTCSPGVHLVRSHDERDVARAGRAVRWKRSALQRHIRAEEQQNARPGTDLKRRTAATGKIIHLPQSEHVLIELGRARQIAHIQRRFKNRLG